MWNKTEWTLIVKFIVTIKGTVYRPGKYTLKWEAYANLLAAPYVREATEEEINTNKQALIKETAARKAKGMKVGKTEPVAPVIIPVEPVTPVVPKEVVETPVVPAEVVENAKPTEVELRALSEVDLRALYTAEQAKIGKTVPVNIGVETIINNLLK